MFIKITLAGLILFTVVTGAEAKNYLGKFGPGNGGDSCEARIIAIRDDIKVWIKGGGSNRLQGVDLVKYNSSMVESIRDAKISCTSDRVFIGTSEKTCQNNLGSGDSRHRILCNFDRLMSTDESE